MENGKSAPRRGVAPDEVSVFCEQVALMLSAGMRLHDGVEAVRDGLPEKSRDLYRVLSDTVDQTGSLYEGLVAAGGFPDYMVEMTRIGEKTGKLEQVMQNLSYYYRREGRIRRSIANAVVYPLVLGVMLACVIIVLVTRVLPIFEQVLGSMGMGMSGAGMALMTFGMTAGKVILILVAALIVLTIAVFVLMRTKYRGRVLSLLRRFFPPLRRINRKLSATRFASVMSMMLQSGFPMEDALAIAPSILPDDLVRERLAEMDAAVKEGMPFSDALEKTGMFDELHNRMIHMGFAAGQVDSVMAKIADIYEEEVDGGISGLISVIEPAMVALLSIVIGAILLSVMLPMAGVIASIL